MTVLICLKVAVSAVTLLLIVSVICLLLKKFRLHGIINTIVAILTLLTLIIFEGILHFSNPPLTSSFTPDELRMLKIHLYFAVPLVPMLFFMLWTGRRRQRTRHLSLAVLFVILWVGMFITGIFGLPNG